MMQLRGDGTVIQTETRCRRCGGNRLWKDAIVGDAHCVQCEPPQQVIRQLIDAQILRKLAKRAQMRKMEDEDAEDELRQEYSARTGKTS